MEQPNQKRVNSGYLFRNKDKRTDKQPDYRGKLTDAEGKEWLLSGWIRNKDGEEMISISQTDPAALPQREGAAPGARPAAPSQAKGPMARPATPSPAKAAAPKAFQPGAGKTAGSAEFDDMEDLDSLFNGLDDHK